VKQVQTFLDALHGEELVSLENEFHCLVVVLHSSWSLNRQELHNFVVLWEDRVCCPEALIAFLNFVYGPQEFALEDQHLNVVWVFFKAVFDFLES